jgi:hypothetical protein
MEHTSLFNTEAMMPTTLFSFACADARDAMTSCKRVRISREAETAVSIMELR